MAGWGDSLLLSYLLLCSVNDAMSMGNAKIIAALTKAQKGMSAKKGRTGTHKNRSNQYIKGTAQKERTDKVIAFKPRLETYEAIQEEMRSLGMSTTEWLDMVVEKHFDRDHSLEKSMSMIPPSCVLDIKLLKLHCTWAGFIRAGALYGQTIKGYETRSSSGAVGKNYRGWVAIASTQVPEEPDWTLVGAVSDRAAKQYRDPRWLTRLKDPELYKPGCILAVARVSDVLQMGEDVYPGTKLEEMTGDWDAGRWAIKLEDAIAPDKPIPYNIPGQGAVFLSEEKHGLVYEQVVELIAHASHTRGTS